MVLKLINKSFSAFLRFDRGIWFILAFFILFFLPYVIAGKSLYPVTEGRGVQFANENPSFLSAVTHPFYLDHGATDWIESPLNAVVNSSIKNEAWPFWNPYSSLGMPILANTNGATLAPLSFFLNFFNSESAWNLMFVFRLFIAVIFTYAFLQRLGLELFPALIGALFFGFSGYSQLHLNMFHYNVDAILPCLLWSTLYYIQTFSRSSWIFLVLSIIAMILGGNPQNLILSSAFAVFLFLYLSSGKNYFVAIKYYSLYFFAYILAAGSCFFFAASFYELYTLALKYHDGVGLTGLPLKSLLGLFFPVFFAWPDLGSATLNYIGFLTFPLIISGISFQGLTRKPAIFFSITACLLILKVIAFPLINWIGYLPALDNILFIKYLSALYFSIAVLLALAVQRLRNCEKRLAVCVLCFSLLSTVVFLVITRGDRGIANPFLSNWMVIFVYPVFLLVIFKRIFFNTKNYFTYIVLFYIFAEFCLLRWHSIPSMLDKGVAFKTPKFIEFLQKDREHEFDRVFGIGNILMGNQASLYQIQDIRGLSATLDKKYYTFMRELILDNQLDLHPFITSSRTYHPDGRPFLNLLGVKYLLFDDCAERKIDSATLIHKELCLEIHKNEAAFERAFVVRDYLFFENDESLLAGMKDGADKLSKSAFLLNLDRTHIPKAQQSSSVTDGDKIQIFSYKTDEVIITAHLESAGLLILSDLSFPGWAVYVDGKRQELLTVDYILRGVSVEAGDHSIRFSYQPSFLTSGVFVSLCSVFLILAVGYLGFKNSKIVLSSFDGNLKR